MHGCLGAETGITLAGRAFTPAEIELVKQLLRAYASLSRHELAATVCELLGWQRPNGKLKTRECRDLLERLAERDRINLPGKRPGRPTGSATQSMLADDPAQAPAVIGDLKGVRPIGWVPVDTPAQHRRWRNLVASHHYLGYATAFGASLRYLAYGGDQSTPLACVQYSSPAWRMRARDQWVGWNDATRSRNLQQVVNQSRFLILPWVKVKNLASHLLSLSTKRLAADWQERFNVQPLLLETLVDTRRYQGTCYRAANWILVGTTTGRGRMDAAHNRHNQAPKSIFVHPLHKTTREQLRK